MPSSSNEIIRDSIFDKLVEAEFIRVINEFQNRYMFFFDDNFKY